MKPKFEQGHAFSFDSFCIQHATIDVDRDKLIAGDEIPVGLHLAKKVVLDSKDNTGRVYLFCKVDVPAEGEDRIIRLEAVIYGNFSIKSQQNVDPEVVRSLFDMNGPHILFPYLRSAVSSITAAAGIEALTLPVVNTAAIPAISETDSKERMEKRPSQKSF